MDSYDKMRADFNRMRDAERDLIAAPFRAEIARLREVMEEAIRLERALSTVGPDGTTLVMRILTAALSPAPGEEEDPRDAKIAELRGLLLAFIKAEGAMASDCDGVYPDVFDAIEKTVAALRDPSHPCAMCGGVDWRIRATPGGEFDEVFERCDHQPVEPDEDDDGPLDLSQMGAVLDGLARGLRDLPPPPTPTPPEEARGEGRCARSCDHGSRCTLPTEHGDRHETDHGCIAYDPRPTPEKASEP